MIAGGFGDTLERVNADAHIISPDPIAWWCPAATAPISKATVTRSGYTTDAALLVDAQPINSVDLLDVWKLETRALSLGITVVA